MKRVSVLILVLLLVFSSVLVAKKSYSNVYKGAKKFGIGIVVGGATSGAMNSGLSLKKWVNSTDALQGDVSWNFNAGVFGVGVAYLMHNFEIIQVERNKFPLYFGIKGWGTFYGDGVGLGIQIPFGIAWIPRNAPVDIFVQVEPGIMLIPATTFAGSGGLGIRYWF